MEWHYAIDGQSHGPVSEQEFAQLVANRTIQPETLVWQEGMDDWLPYGRMAGGSTPSAGTPKWETAPAWDNGNPARPDASTFVGALKDALARYADFSTRSNRPQYWYFVLWSIIIGLVTVTLDIMMGFSPTGLLPINTLASLALLIPSLALVVRRLHDIGRSGWWFLLFLVPVIGWIVLIVFYCTASEPRANQWGNPPH